MAVHGLHRKLRWSDFRKIHESTNGFDAQTFTNISVQTRFAFNGQGNWRVTRVNVTLSLNQRKTWVISRGVLQEVQDRYDDDATCGSDHSRNRDNQALWTLNISRVLADDAAGIDELNSCPRPRATPQAAGQ